MCRGYVNLSYQILKSREVILLLLTGYNVDVFYKSFL